MLEITQWKLTKDEADCCSEDTIITAAGSAGSSARARHG
jgi:hypothetical protein